MPKQSATTTTFNDFITAAIAKIPDPTIAQQFTTTFGGLIEQTPANILSELDNQTSSSLMFHRDYSRLVGEQRAEATQLQQQAATLAQREQELQLLSSQAVSRAEYDQLQQQLTDTRNRATWADTLRTRLDEMDLTELVLDGEELQQFRGLGQPATVPGDTTMPDPATTNNGNGQPPAGTPTPQWLNGQWYFPVNAPVATSMQQQQQFQQQPPAATTPPQDIEAIINARVQAALGEVLPHFGAQVYGASAQTALEMQGFANEWQQLKGESIDPRQLNQEFINSGKQFNDFLEEKFKLSDAREAKRVATYQADVDAAAEQKLQQRLGEMTTAGTLRNGIPANPGSTPLFESIAARPNGLRQAYQSTPGSNVPPPTPQAAPSATPSAAQPPVLPSTPPPNPGEQSGLQAAAAALADGRFANARFDPTRPMGAPGMA